MVAKTFLGLSLALSLALSGCGGGDDAEAKQAALGPATAVDADEAPASAPASDSSAAAKAAGPTESTIAARPYDSAGAPAIDNEALGRESFSYTGGPRDPFQSLLASARIGPEISDLTLVAIYYDTRNPSASVSVLRDKIDNKKYSLRPGDRLGRAWVVSIRPKDMTFAIDDFGTVRHVIVSLRKQEETQ